MGILDAIYKALGHLNPPAHKVRDRGIALQVRARLQAKKDAAARLSGKPPAPTASAAPAPAPAKPAALTPDMQRRAEALKSLKFPTRHAVQAYKDLTGEVHPRAAQAKDRTVKPAFVPHPPGAVPAKRKTFKFNKPPAPEPTKPAASGTPAPAPYVPLKKRKRDQQRIQRRIHFWKHGDGRDGRPNRAQAGWLRKNGYRHPLDKYDDAELKKYMESYMATANLIERLNHALHGSVFKAGWDKPKRDLHSLGREHNFTVKGHPKGGHVAFVHRDVYHKIKPHLGTHAATELGDHVRVRTAGPKIESVVEAKMRFRSQDGKWRNLHHKGIVQMQSAVPKKFRLRVEAMGAKIQQAGAGIALVFEDLAKAEACFQALTADGMRIVKHDIPGILYVQNALAEAHQPVGYQPAKGSLDSLATSDFQGRKGAYPKSGVPDVIQVHGQHVHAEFKNTREAHAKAWLQSHLTKHGHAIDSISTSQDGDYGDDWVTAHAIVKPKAVKEAEGNDPGPEEFGAGAGPVADQIPGGKGDGKADAAFDEEQLEAGVKVEMEHTNDPAKAREIAKDHLSEDPHYYTKLKKAGLADELEKSESVIARINAALGENFAQVFDDADAACDACCRRSNGMGGWIVLAVGGTYTVLPEEEAEDRLESDPSATVYASYYDGDRMGGVEDDEDDLDERHSAASRLSNSNARKGLLAGKLKRAKNNRLVRKATARRGAIYAARRAARTATHNSRKDA